MYASGWAQIWALSKKDLRRVWPGLAALYAVLALRAGAAWRDPLLSEYPRLPSSSVLPDSTHLLTIVGCVLVTAWVTQLDRHVGTTSFWMTRPISRGAVGVGKALFLLAWVIAPPVLTHLVVLLRFGWSPDGLLLGLRTSGLLAITVWVAATAAIGTLTGRMGYALGGWIGCMTLAGAVSTWMLPYLLGPRWPQDQLFQLSADAEAAKSLALNALAVLACGLVAVHQIRYRATRRSYAVAGVVLLLVMIGDHLRLRIPNQLLETPRFVGDTFQIRPERGRVDYRTDGYYSRTEAAVWAHPKWNDLSRGDEAEIKFIRGRLQSGGREILLQRRYDGQGWIAARGVGGPLEGYELLATPPAEDDHVRVSFPRRFALSDDPASLRATFELRRRRHEFIVNLPLLEGATAEADGVAVRIVSLTRTEEWVSAGFGNRLLVSRSNEVLHFEWLLVNHHRRQILAGNERRQGYVRYPLVLWEGGILLARGRSVVEFPRVAYNGDQRRIEISDKWLDGAQVAAVQLVAADPVYADVRIDDLHMSVASPDPTSEKAPKSE